MRLEVSCFDRMGLAKDILIILEQFGINLMSIDASNKGFLYVKFAEIEFDLLSELMPRIRKIESVIDVRTVMSMPVEQEHYALTTLLNTLAEPVFAIDLKGRVNIVNEAAMSILAVSEDNLIGQPLNQWLQGINFCRLLTETPIVFNAIHVNVEQQDFLADIQPIYLVEDNQNIPLGAVIVLKSPARVGKELIALQNKTLGFERVLAVSDKMQEVIKKAKRLSQLPQPLLIIGETGVGKELIAQACHDASIRKDKPFIVINCALFSDCNNEDELSLIFSSKITLLNEAGGGTIFFDEITDLSITIQLKLLQALQHNPFDMSLLDDETRKNIRIIAATKKDIKDLCAKDKFNEALYYRLNVLTIDIPSLRERKQDILPLAEMFLAYFSLELPSSVKRLSINCREKLLSNEWLGNVRQLKNTIYKGMSMAEGCIELSTTHIDLPSGTENEMLNFEGTLDETMKQYEASLLSRLYPFYPSTRQLAKKLGVSHTAIANKLREYKINKNKK